MLTTEENDLLTQTGPGTPMGNLMREYWIPALVSSELPAPDCDPVRLLLLGEKLIAFRNSEGVVGILPNACPHRGASLFFGQVQDGCLRCVYHGWQFDTSGKVVDMPNEPPESDFKDRLPKFGYPTMEKGGVVWAYMGTRDDPPPLPHLDAYDFPDEDLMVVARQFECNWLQAMEGDIDTVHAGFLHAGHGVVGDAPEGTFMDHVIRERKVRYKLVDTEAGVLTTAYRPVGDGSQTYHRIASFALPFYTYAPTGVLGVPHSPAITVPMDDEHVIRWFIGIKPGQVPDLGAAEGQRVALFTEKTPNFPNDTTWHGRFKPVKGMFNDFEVDRQMQKRGESFSGITGFTIEDKAMTESMGSIVDRTREHLGTTDAMVIRVRRRLLATLREHQGGGDPNGLYNADVYHQRTGGVVLEADADWISATEHLRKAGTIHPDLDPRLAAGI